MTKKKKSPLPRVGILETPLPVETELTPIAYVRSLGPKISEITGYVSQIPEVRSLALEAKERSVRVEEKVTGLDSRVTRVEATLNGGHGCVKQSSIRRLEATDSYIKEKMLEGIKEGIKNRERLTHVAEKIDETDKVIRKHSDNRRQLYVALLGILAMACVGIGGSIWYFSNLDAGISRDRQENSRRYQQITVQIKALNKKVDASSVVDQMRALEHTIEKGLKENARSRTFEEFNAWYDNLNRREKSGLRYSPREDAWKTWRGQTTEKNGKGVDENLE